VTRSSVLLEDLGPSLPHGVAKVLAEDFPVECRVHPGVPGQDVERQLNAGYNESTELIHFIGNLQSATTQPNLARFAKSRVVLKFSRSEPQDSDIPY